MNIIVIGAGPSGGYVSYLLAKAGHKVTLYEEHGEIGSPIQCTGLLTSNFDKLDLPINSFLVNIFSRIEVCSPHHKTSIEQKEYLVDRRKFDAFLVNLALKEGAKVWLNHSFIRREGKKIIIKDLVHKEEKTITPDIVIAADGPLSKMAKAYGLYHPERQNYYGIQALVEGNFDSSRYQTFFGNETCPDLFAWIVPESATKARVGLASTKEAKKHFDKFMNEYNFTPLEIQAGTIPLYHPQQKLQKEDCYLLGDAAGFVKATTLGGIIPGLKQAEILADCINNQKNYEKEVKSLQKQLNWHLRLRKIFNKFSDQDWDKLLLLVNQPKVKDIFKKNTRENPFPILMKALLKEPRLLYFGKFLF